MRRHVEAVLALLTTCPLVGCATPPSSSPSVVLFERLQDAAQDRDLLDELYDSLTPASRDRYDWPDLLFLLAMPYRFNDIPDLAAVFSNGQLVGVRRGSLLSEVFLLVENGPHVYRLLCIVGDSGAWKIGLAEQLLHISSGHAEYSWRVVE